MSYLTIKDLSRIHGKSKSFFETILCRIEFGKFRIDSNKNYFKFNNEIELHRTIRRIIAQKELVGNSCRGVY